MNDDWTWQKFWEENLPDNIFEETSVTDNLSRYVAILAEVQFHDWKFLIQSDGAGAYLQIEFSAPDTKRDDSVVVWRGRKWRLSEHMTKSEIVLTAWMAVKAAIEHEAREAFLYRGRAIFGPHIDVDALHGVAELTDERKL